LAGLIILDKHGGLYLVNRFGIFIKKKSYEQGNKNSKRKKIPEPKKLKEH